MRPKLSIKLMLRSPVKTTVTFLLLVAITFALFSRILDFGASTRQFAAADAAYRGVGWVESAPPEYTDISTPRFLTGLWYNPDNPLDGTWEDTRYQALTADQMEAVANLPYVSSTSTRYLTAGISPRFKRIDGKPSFYDYTTRYVVEVTLHENFWGDEIHEMFFMGDSYETLKKKIYKNLISVINIETLTDDALFPQRHNMMTRLVYYLVNWAALGDQPVLDIAHSTMWICDQKIFGGYIMPFRFGELYGGKLDKRITHNTTFPLLYDQEESRTMGEKYLVIAGYYTTHSIEDILDYIFLGDSVAEYWCDIFVPLGEYGDDYLDLPEFEGYRQLIEITNQDYYTFDVVYTDDMAAIPRFNDRKMGMEEGRMLTAEDEGSEVCIINLELSKRHGLKIGDSFPLSLCDKLFEQHAGLGAVAATRGRFSTPVKDVNPTIVGIYRDYDSELAQGLAAHHSYSANTVFVPLSMLPESADTENASIKPGSFSINVLDKTKLASFTEEAAPIIESMGLTLNFSDGGWSEIVRNFTLARTISIIAISALLVAMAAATGLVVHLFIGQRRREYAVMRATGCEKSLAARSLLLPFFLLTLTAVILGGIGAYLGSLGGGEYSMAGWIYLLCIVAAAAFVTLAACFGLWKISKTPPLALLQAVPAPARKRKTAPVAESSVNVTIPAGDIIIPPLPDRRKNNAAAQVSKYIFRNLRRSAGRSLLSLLLTALILCAVGQFAAVLSSTKQLFDTYTITAAFMGEITEADLLDYKLTGMLADPNYQAANLDALVESGGRLVDLRLSVSNRPKEMFSGEITYGPGYSEHMLTDGGFFCIVDRRLLDDHGFAEGQTVTLVSVIQDEVTGEVKNYEADFTIIGSIGGLKGELLEVLIPPGDPFKALYKKPVYSYVSYTLTDNSRTSELREKAANVYITEKVDFAMNTADLDQIGNNLTLLNYFFPIVFAALLIISGLAPGLMILQASGEASLLRILGTSRIRTRCILFFQQLVLLCLGLGLGLGILAVGNGAKIGEISVTLAAFSASCLVWAGGCAAVAAVVVTRRNVLDLLQTKE